MAGQMQQTIEMAVTVWLFGLHATVGSQASASVHPAFEPLRGILY